MKQLKYTTGFCRCHAKEVEISYLHITTSTHLQSPDGLYAEAIINCVCLEHDSCLQKDCAQNNCFGQQYLEVHESHP